MSKRVARLYLKRAYEARGALEKVIGKMVSRQYGLTDQPQEFFDDVKQIVYDTLGTQDIDLSDPMVYDDIQRAIVEVLNQD
jgi:hypothetical protein